MKPLVAKSFVIFNNLMHIFTFKYKLLKLKSMILLKLETLAATIGFKIMVMKHFSKLEHSLTSLAQSEMPRENQPKKELGTGSSRR